ncbi:protein GRIM REAPER [Macadamia integrifolia]|uniref:protein GRIM REAPER n=1 Tax=Macadamia integrifolia TaxID=60698 RepID=UPI001C501FED|nr:protein GRIM REAPER [Macadamia integrifolia]
MATTLLSCILSFSIIALILILSNPHLTLSMDFSTDIVHDEDGEDQYLVDSTQSMIKIKKGAHCNPFTNNICNGIQVNNGTGLLHCCKTHCTNILSDQNNCGRCQHKCGFGQRCCHGRCTNVSFNPNHCGKCNRKCFHGIKCEFGICGYA